MSSSAAVKRRLVFICNNYWHLYLSRSVAYALRGRVQSSLALVGMIPSIADEHHIGDGWVSVTRHLDDKSHVGVPKWAFRIASFKKEFKRAHGSAEAVICFVDKYYLNQIAIRILPSSIKVLIEEGIGLYNPNRATSGVASIALRLICLLQGERCSSEWAEQGGAGLCDYLLCRWPRLLPASKAQLFKEVIDVSDSYRLGFIPKVTGCAGDLQGKKIDVLFIGSDTVGAGVPQEMEQGVINKVHQFCVELSLTVAFKLHPRELVQKYSGVPDACILRGGHPAEVVAARNNSKLIISVMSSALLNIKGVRVCLARLFPVQFANGDFLSTVAEDCKLCMPSDMVEVEKLMREVSADNKGVKRAEGYIEDRDIFLSRVIMDKISDRSLG